MQKHKAFCEEHGIKQLDTTGAFANVFNEMTEEKACFLEKIMLKNTK